MKLIREMPDLFRLVRFAPVNSYFVREDDGLTLVDANLPGRAEKIVEKALRMELPIKRIALTHTRIWTTWARSTPSANWFPTPKFLSGRANRG
jgi:glyoxylase-like metal-dependent hydrolase (beta-lactamase superfamily II)